MRLKFFLLQWLLLSGALLCLGVPTGFQVKELRLYDTEARKSLRVEESNTYNLGENKKYTIVATVSGTNQGVKETVVFFVGKEGGIPLFVQAEKYPPFCLAGDSGKGPNPTRLPIGEGIAISAASYKRDKNGQMTGKPTSKLTVVFNFSSDGVAAEPKSERKPVSDEKSDSEAESEPECE